MNIFDLVKNLVLDVFASNFAGQASAVDSILAKSDTISFDKPNNSENGDISTNIAMVCSKELKISPVEIAKKLVLLLATNDLFDKVEMAGPGFINFSMNKNLFNQLIGKILSLSDDFGRNIIGNNYPVNLEFISTNPTGPMHIGHLRNAVFGEALANLMIFSGYQVTREFYINDAGGQIDVLADSVLLRYKEIAFNEKIIIPEGLYPGEYLIDIAQKIYQKNSHLISADGSVDREFLKTEAVSGIMELIKQDLILLGINFDVFFSEKSLHANKAIEKTIDLLASKSMIYRGVLEAPKGQQPEEYEPREQLLFRSTKYGDDVDRPVQKSNGSWTYIAADIAYMQDKIARGFKKLIFVLGADHGGYQPRLSAASIALSGGEVSVEVKLIQLVRFVKDGEIVKMSKRSGNFLTAREVVEEVGKDAVFLTLLSRKNDQAMDFDFSKVMEQNKDNPVFYVQYASARISSVLRIMENEYPEIWNLELNEHAQNLAYPPEIYELIKLLGFFPKIIQQSAASSEPHRIIFYLIELASCFHHLWNMGKEKEELRFIQAGNPILSKKYVFLLKATKIVLRNGLNLFNIKALDSM